MSPASCHPQQAPITQRRRRHGLPDTSVSAAKGTGVPCPLPAFPGGAATGSGTCLVPNTMGGHLHMSPRQVCHADRSPWVPRAGAWLRYQALGQPWPPAWSPSPPGCDPTSLGHPQPPVPVALSRAQPLRPLLQPVLDGAKRDVRSLLPQLLQPLLPCSRESCQMLAPRSSRSVTPPKLLTLQFFGAESWPFAHSTPCSSSSAACLPSDARRAQRIQLASPWG